MESIVRVTAIEPLNQRQYTDKNGAQQVINERGVWMQCGSSKMRGVMLGNHAASFNAADPGLLEQPCVAQFDIITRTSESDGKNYVFTDVRINRLEKL